MASEKLLRIAMKLAKSLGANESKYLGKRSNINFLGKGPEEGKLFQSDINTESLAALPLNKVLPEIETSMSYASGGKLNDLQINKLIDNMSKMADFYRPVTVDSVANLTDMASGTGNLTGKGLESLRGLNLKNFDNIRNRKIDPASYEDRGGNIIPAEFGKSGPLAESPLMSKISDRVSNIKNDTSVSGQNFLDKMAEITSRSAPLEETAIMKTIPKNDIAGKTASSREFLLNALKEGDDAGRTVFRDTISPQDLKYITEGGGGVDGDPIVLVQKYFGPRVAELIPATSSVEDMVVFTKRVLETATDAKGLRPTDPGFDKFTLKLQESVKETPDGFPFAKGGRAGFFQGALADTAEGKAMSPGTSATGEFRGGDGNGNVNTIVTNVPTGDGAPVVASPTNVGNPFGYQDNIRTAALNTRTNRYDTDTDENIDVPKYSMEDMFGITPNNLPDNTQVAKAYNTKDMIDLLGIKDKKTASKFVEDPVLGSPRFIAEKSWKDPLTQPQAMDKFHQNLKEQIKEHSEKTFEQQRDASFLGIRPKERSLVPTNFLDVLKDVGNQKDFSDIAVEIEKKYPMAEGGRAGYRVGGIAKAILKKISNKMIKKAADDIFPTNDYKYDAEMVVDALVENNPKLFKNMLADDLDDALRSDLYGLAVRETGLRVGAKIKARRAAVDRGIVNEIPEPFKRESMKLADGVTGKGEKFKTFETTTPPRMFQLNVEKAVSELNIPRAEAMRIAQLPSSEQKLALQKYLDMDLAQRTELMNYEPRKFDAAHGGLAKILEV